MKKVICMFLFLGIISSLISQESISLNALDSLKTILNRELKATEPGAAILINYQGKTIFEEYYGMAHVSTLESLGPKHQMGIASMSKQFEGMAVLKLVEQGKLSLNDDISLYLPDLPIEERKISIAQLLSHTSGLPELTKDSAFMEHLDQKRSVDELIELAFSQNLRSEPGEKYEYCNTGYTIMVKVIEKVSGMKYAKFLDQNFFKPLQMDHTYSCDYEQDAQNIATRYIQDSSGFQLAEVMDFSNLIGGGGIVSNAQDINKWNEALLTGHALPENYQELWNPILLNNGETTNYGLGMGLSAHRGHPFYYHPGMGSGMNAINLLFPDQQLGVVIIRNISKPNLSSVQIALLIADLLVE